MQDSYRWYSRKGEFPPEVRHQARRRPGCEWCIHPQSPEIGVMQVHHWIYLASEQAKTIAGVVTKLVLDDIVPPTTSRWFRDSFNPQLAHHVGEEIIGSIANAGYLHADCHRSLHDRYQQPSDAIVQQVIIHWFQLISYNPTYISLVHLLREKQRDRRC